MAKRSFWRNFSIVTASVFALAAAFPAVPAYAAPTGSSPSQPSAPAHRQVDPAQAYQEGVAALQAGDYKLAERKFADVLSVAENSPEANYYMGLAKVGRGKEKASVRYFKKAIKERADFVEAREQLALAYIKIDDREDAEAQLTAIRELRAGCENEECEDAFVQRTDRAIAKVEAALAGGGEDISAAPAEMKLAMLLGAARGDGDARYGAAVRFINQGLYREAISELYMSQAIIGPHPDILNYLGYAHRKAGDFETAQSYYAAALNLDPDHLGANEYLGELYLELGQIDHAKSQLARLDQLCAFGCAEREDLARMIVVKESTRTAGR